MEVQDSPKGILDRGGEECKKWRDEFEPGAQALSHIGG